MQLTLRVQVTVRTPLMLRAQIALVEAALAVPGALPSVVTDGAVSDALRDKAASLQAARAVSAQLDEESVQLLADAKSPVSPAGKAILAQAATEKACKAAASRKAALGAAGFSGGASLAGDVDSAIAGLGHLLQAQAALTEAARHAPPALLRGSVAGLVADDALRACVTRLTEARAAAGRLDDEAARLRAESSAARGRASSDALLRAIADKRVDKARTLIERGGALVVTIVGPSALASALAAGLDDVAVLLIERGAGIGAVEAASGMTPLELCRLGKTPRGRALVEAAARSEAARVAGLAPAEFGIAARAARAAMGAAKAHVLGKQLVMACYLGSEIFAWASTRQAHAADALRLIGEGADLDCIVRNGHHRSLIQDDFARPLHVAVELTIKFVDLVDKSHVLDHIRGSGDSALHYASSHEVLDGVAARLIAAGAKLNLVNKYGASALIVACSNCRAETALQLVEANAELNHVAFGKSALDWAYEKGLGAVRRAIHARGGRTGAELKAGR